MPTPTSYTKWSNITPTTTAINTDTIVLSGNKLIRFDNFINSMTDVPFSGVQDWGGISAVTTAGETNNLLLNGSNTITLANLRKSLNGTFVIFVPPSNAANNSSNPDRANIQAAIDTLQAAATEYFGQGVVLLSGRYYLDNTPLVLGVVNSANSRVSIHGIGSAYLELCYGASTPSSGYAPYLLKAYGGNHATRVMLSNLCFSGQYKRRGLLLADVRECIIENVRCEYTIESAIDAIDCWWTDFRSIEVGNMYGFALRTQSCNGCHMDSLKLVNGYAIYSLHSATYTDTVLSAYAMDNGGIAGHDTLWDAAHQAEDASAWPATDDTSCTDYSGTVFTTTEAQRACMFFFGNGTTFTNLCIENSYYLDYPLIHMSSNTQSALFTSIRLENVHCLNEMVKCVGSRYNQFENVWCVNSHSASGECKCFLRCTGKTRANSVKRLCGWGGLTDNIMILGSGTHTANMVSECATAYAYIPSSGWIGVTDNPTINASWDDVFDSVN